MLRHRQCICVNCQQEVQEEGAGLLQAKQKQSLEKRINDSYQGVWGNDHKIVRTERKHSLTEYCTSFEMQRMRTRTDQLLHIAEDTGSKIYTKESEAETHSKEKALVLS